MRKVFIMNDIKNEILQLRRLGKTYKEIATILDCSKKKVAYHCSRNGLGDKRTKLKDLDLELVNKFYQTHTLEETANFFGVKGVSLRLYLHRKEVPVVKLSEAELKQRNIFKVNKRRRKLKKLAIDYKGGKCEKCGYNRSQRALEFHHTDPRQKDFGIARSGYSLAWDKLKKELDKCLLVCANCHAEIHEQIDGDA
jgi:hypothetical protein